MRFEDLTGAVHSLEQGQGEILVTLGKLDTMMTDLQATTSDVARLSGSLGEEADRLPQLLASLDEVMAELSQTMPALRGLVSDASAASTALPTLLVQSEQTFAELENLLIRLQGLWLFGGDSGPSTERTRLSPLEARP